MSNFRGKTKFQLHRSGTFSQKKKHKMILLIQIFSLELFFYINHSYFNHTFENRVESEETASEELN